MTRKSIITSDNTIATGVENGVTWATKTGPMGQVNGYVQIPPEHPWRDIEDIQFDGHPDVDVHGGITYGVDEEGWIGFDTSHYLDNWPGGLMNSPDGIDWTPEMVAGEARKFAGHVAEANTNV